MKKKNAIVIVELVDESVQEKNDNIAHELIDWFGDDAVFVPWVKSVKAVSIKEE